MSERVLLATFEHEDDLLAAAKPCGRKGYAFVDAFTPYAVHGLDRAMGLKPSRLTWVCFACGMLGALGMLWFEHWTASVDWALDVGGKPWNSLPSDVPVAFEAAVLAGWIRIGICIAGGQSTLSWQTARTGASSRDRRSVRTRHRRSRCRLRCGCGS